MKQAVIDPASGLVENVILAAPGFEIPGRLLVPSDTAGPGDTYDAETGTFTGPPEPPEPSEQERREAWRLTAVLSRAQFCIACKRAGLMTQAEAVGAAKGEVPAPLADAIAALPKAEAEEAEILWAGLTQVERLHPISDLVAAHMGLSPEAVDDLFGWTG